MSSISTSLDEVLARIQQLTPPSFSAALPVVAGGTSAGTTAATTTTSSAGSSSGFGDALSLASTPAAEGSAVATSDGGSAAPYAATIDAAAQRNGLDPALIQAVIEQESGFDPNATSSAGAQGLMQLMPSTAASLGVSDPYDPTQSIEGGARYLKEELDQFGGNVSLALAAYNAGGGAVSRYGGIPPYPQTQNYVQQVTARYQQLVDERTAN